MSLSQSTSLRFIQVSYDDKIRSLQVLECPVRPNSATDTFFASKSNYEQAMGYSAGFGKTLFWMIDCSWILMILRSRKLCFWIASRTTHRHLGPAQTDAHHAASDESILGRCGVGPYT